MDEGEASLVLLVVDLLKIRIGFDQKVRFESVGSKFESNSNPWVMTTFPHYSSISSEAVAGWKGSCRTVAVLYSKKCVSIWRFSSFLYMKVYDFQIAFELCVDAMLAAWPQYLLHLQEVVLPLQLLDTVHLKVHHQPLHDLLIELWISLVVDVRRPL